MYKLKTIKLTNIVGSISTFSLLVLAFLTITPPITEGASAEEVTTNLNITAEPTLSIALDESVNMHFTPNSAGEFQPSAAKLTINTNQADGYKIFLATVGSSADINNTNTNGVIKNLASTATAASFPDNSWGYSLAKSSETVTSYSPVPRDSTEVMNIDADAVALGIPVDYNLNFGVKVSSSLPAGTYSKQVIVSAVANPVKLRTLDDLTYMQDMRADICANTKGTDGQAVTANLKNEPSKQLVDIRDGKSYWVSKLADQNCWMTQNLALDITEGMINNNEINPTNTDVSEIWNKNSIYPPSKTVTDNIFSHTSNGTKNWNLGNFYIDDPVLVKRCSISSGTSTESCDRVKALDMNNVAGNVLMHQSLGNYYQQYAATAGSGAYITSGNPDDSICPKNWRLPLGSESSTDKSFANLLQAYSVTGVEALVTSPLYFQRSGSLDNAALEYLGDIGMYWSKTDNSSFSYSLWFGATNDIRLSNDNSHLEGVYPVRCLAR